MNALKNYLTPDRLSDILSLIQVLAYDRETTRSEEGIFCELQRKPGSTNSWITLSKHHPEFFRVSNQNPPRAALIARFVTEHELLADGGESKRPPLDSVAVNKLMELAIELYGKAVERNERWKGILLPIAVAFISAAAAITSSFATQHFLRQKSSIPIQLNCSHSSKTP